MNEKELQAAETLINLALLEDVGTGDITTDNLIPAEIRRKAKMVAKADGVVAGLPVAEMVFRKLDKNLVWNVKIQEGQKVQFGDVIVEFEGTYRALLTGERTALTFYNECRASPPCRPNMPKQFLILKPLSSIPEKHYPAFAYSTNMR
jgi:nicotinate-nucleotide pyrophosphorylase (carboxylating)